MANRQIKIDRIAIWRAASNLKEGEVNVMKSPAGIKYLPKDSNVYKISTEPMYRYVKNYVVGDVKYSLFVRTFSDAEKRIEIELDYAAKTITEEYARSIVTDPDVLNFEYLDIFVNEKDIIEATINEELIDQEIMDSEIIENNEEES